MTRLWTRSGLGLELAYGQSRETVLRELLLAHPATIEVKSDRRCRETHSLFIETHQRFADEVDWRPPRMASLARSTGRRRSLRLSSPPGALSGTATLRG